MKRILTLSLTLLLLLSAVPAVSAEQVVATEEDVILLAGKGHEEYEITREGRRSFSEKELVKEAFALRLQRSKSTHVTETEP